MRPLREQSGVGRVAGMSTEQENKLKSGAVLIGADALDVAKAMLSKASKHRRNEAACRELAECIERAERKSGEAHFPAP
jgi:hypothetical protein